MAGPPRVGADTGGLGELFDVVNIHEFGGVFSDELPDLKEALDRFKRRSVLTDVGKLARQLGPEIRELYEWLSNVAHPSFGTMHAYCSPMHIHPTGTHSVRVVAGDPGCAALAALRGTRQSRMDSVGGMTVRAVALGCRHAVVTLERALRIVDDLGLTSGAAKAAPWPYWRALEPAVRNARCPCRAGRKAKACGHEWGLPAWGFRS
jgi:hypothetical protein